MTIEYAIIVKNKTRLELLTERFNTQAQARFYIERSGGVFQDYQAEHEQFHDSLSLMQRQLSTVIKNKIVERNFLPSFLFNANQVVIVIGQDGLVANTAKYVNGIGLLGLAAACAIRFKGSKTWLAGVLALLATATFFIQSPYFGEHFAHDPFAAKPSQFRRVNANLVPVTAVIPEPNAAFLRLSPQAKRLAYVRMKLSEDGYYDESEQPPFTFSDFKLPPTTLDVLDLAFVDDDRILTLNAGENVSLQLRRWQNGNWETDQTWQLPNNFSNDHIAWDTTNQSWLLTGYGIDNDNLMRISGQLGNPNIYTKTIEPAADPYDNYQFAQYDLKETLLRVYRIKPDKTKPKIWDKYIDQRYTLFSVSQNKFWSVIAKTSSYDVYCMSNTVGAITVQIPCLYENAGNQYLGIFNIKSGQLDNAVFLDKDNKGYYLLGQKDGIILVGKNNAQLFAINFEEKLIYELILPKLAMPFEKPTWNGQYFCY
jgi:hypothetical protein